MLLHPDLRYECPQTREYIDGAGGYLDMFRTWPGNWTAKLSTLICDQDQGVSIIDFLVGDEKVVGISIFEFSAGLISKVTDFWPEAYDPPARATPHFKRRPK